MLTLNELDKIWETKIQPQVQELSQKHEKEHSKLIVLHILLYITSVVVYHFFIVPALAIEPDYGFSLAISMIPNLIYVLYESGIKDKQIKSIKSFYNVFLNPLGITHSTEVSEFIDATHIATTKIFDCDFAYFDDIFTGKFRDIPYQILETTLKKSISSKTSVEVFSGVAILINDFLGIDKTVTYVDGKVENSKIIPEQDSEITKFISILKSNIPKYKGIMFIAGKILIFCEHKGNLFEVPTINVTKDEFISMLLEINNFLSYMDKINLNEYYEFPQASLLRSVDDDTRLTPVSIIVSFVIYAILTGLGAYIVWGLLLFFLSANNLISFELCFLLGTILPVITAILFACHLIKQDIEKDKKKIRKRKIPDVYKSITLLSI